MKYLLGAERLTTAEPAGYYRIQNSDDVVVLELEEGQQLGDIWLAPEGEPDVVRLSLEDLRIVARYRQRGTIEDPELGAELEHQDQRGADNAGTASRLHPDDLAELRRQIVDELGGAVVSAALPASIGDYLRTCGIVGSTWRLYLPMPGDPAGGMWIGSRVLPGGCLELELERNDGSNRPVWRGTLRPVDQLAPRRLADSAAAAGLANGDEHQDDNREGGRRGGVGEAPR